MRRISSALVAIVLAIAGGAFVAQPASAAAVSCNVSSTHYHSTHNSSPHLIPSYGNGGTELCHMGYNISSFNSGVTVLQHTLKVCYKVNITPDGYYGNDTIAALKVAQRAEGLTGADVDGLYGPQTRKLLLWFTYNNGAIGTPCHNMPVRS